MEKNIIVAVADNGAIGKSGKLLWHIPEDLKFFKKQTLGCPVIMGRRTFESIGRALPGRMNIVISHDFSAPENVTVVSSLEEAFRAAEEAKSEKCFVIGGGQIYKQALSQVDKLIVTHVHTTVIDADTFFPSIDPALWTLCHVSETFTDKETGCTFEFVEYKKRRTWWSTYRKGFISC